MRRRSRLLLAIVLAAVLGLVGALLEGSAARNSVLQDLSVSNSEESVYSVPYDVGCVWVYNNGSVECITPVPLLDPCVQGLGYG